MYGVYIMSKSTSSVRNLLARQKAQNKQREAEEELEAKRKAARIAEEEKAKQSGANAEKEGEKEHLFAATGPIPDKIIAAYNKKFPDRHAGNPLQFGSEVETKQFFEEMAKLGERFLFQKQNADGTLVDQYAISVGDGALIYGNHATVVAALSAYKEDSPHYETAQSYLKTLGAQPQKTAAYRDALQAEREPVDAHQSGPKIG